MTSDEVPLEPNQDEGGINAYPVFSVVLVGGSADQGSVSSAGVPSTVLNVLPRIPLAGSRNCHALPGHLRSSRDLKARLVQSADT